MLASVDMVSGIVAPAGCCYCNLAIACLHIETFRRKELAGPFNHKTHPYVHSEQRGGFLLKVFLMDFKKLYKLYKDRLFSDCIS